MRWLNGAVSTLMSMVSTITRPFQDPTRHGASSISVQLAIGKTKSTDAQEQSQPVQSKPKRKPKVAQPTTQAASHKQTQNPVLAVLGQGGLQRVILASQPVSQSPKPKRSVAQRTTQEQSPKRTQKPVQTTNGKDGSQQVTPASKTPQRAKVAQTKKAKAVVSTTQVKKRTQGKTPAKTPTVRQRKVRGA